MVKPVVLLFSLFSSMHVTARCAGGSCPAKDNVLLQAQVQHHSSQPEEEEAGAKLKKAKKEKREGGADGGKMNKAGKIQKLKALKEKVGELDEGKLVSISDCLDGQCKDAEDRKVCAHGALEACAADATEDQREAIASIFSQAKKLKTLKGIMGDREGGGDGGKMNKAAKIKKLKALKDKVGELDDEKLAAIRGCLDGQCKDAEDRGGCAKEALKECAADATEEQREAIAAVFAKAKKLKGLKEKAGGEGLSGESAESLLEGPGEKLAALKKKAAAEIELDSLLDKPGKVPRPGVDSKLKVLKKKAGDGLSDEQKEAVKACLEEAGCNEAEDKKECAKAALGNCFPEASEEMKKKFQKLAALKKKAA